MVCGDSSAARSAQLTNLLESAALVIYNGGLRRGSVGRTPRDLVHLAEADAKLLVSIARSMASSLHPA